MESNQEEVFKENKVFLKRYRRILKKIERLENKLARLNERLFSVKSGQITDMPRGGQSVTLDDIIISKEETIERIESLVDQSRLIRREIYQAIDELEDYRQVEILEQFFIEGLSLKDIADKSGYTERHTIRFYTAAIKTLDISGLSVTCQ